MNNERVNVYLKKIINRETISYSIFGILTAILNIGLYQILLLFNVNYKYANFISLIVTKIVSYVVNKFFVFKSENENVIELCKEFGRFIFTRGATMLIDYFGLILLVDILQYNEYICKYITALVVIIANYFWGRKHVFKTKK